MAQKRSLDLDKVIAKASELIADRGLSEMTMPNLAKALGVRSQSLYHYVSGRHQLLSLVGASRIKELHQELVNNLLGLSGEAALLKFADIVRDFLLKDPTIFSILYHLNDYSHEDTITQEIANIFELGEKLNLRSDNAPSFHVLVGAVLGYVFLDKGLAFTDESAEEANENYHKMILRLVQPAGI